MNLKNKGILIRNATPADAALLCKWWNDGAVMAHAGFPLGLNTTEETIINKINQETDDTTRRHIIVFDGVPIGEMNYIQANKDSCEMGIKICEAAYQNKGFGTKILSLFIKGLFEERKYKKIMLDTNLNNLRAQHVYEKLGFTKVRVNIDSWQNQLGEMQSSVDYELTEDQFLCQL